MFFLPDQKLGNPQDELNGDNLRKAVDMYQTRQFPVKQVATKFGLPVGPFRDYLKTVNVINTDECEIPCKMQEVMEIELLEIVRELESKCFELSPTDVRKLAYQVATKQNISHGFDRTNKLFGKRWTWNFLKKYSVALDCDKPEKGIQNVNNFFNKYKQILNENNFTADKIFTMGFTRLFTGHKPSESVVKKDKERSLTASCVCAMNAAAEFIPPLLIFKRSRIYDFLTKGGPPNAAYKCTKTGWISPYIALEWLKHFIRSLGLKKNTKNQVLLMIDGYDMCVKNIFVIEMAKSYGIVMLSYPRNLTHFLQPLERSFLTLLNSCFSEAASAWIRTNPGHLIVQPHITEFLGIAFPKAVRQNMAESDFKETGLWPFNRDVINNAELEQSVSKAP